MIFPWLIGKGYEFFSKKKISHNTWFFLILGGILPDADFILDWGFGMDLHRTFSHSLFFLVIISLLVYFVWIKSSQRKIFSIAIAVGIGSHLIADMASNPGIPLLWPSLIHFSIWGMGYLAPNSPSLLFAPKEVMLFNLKRAVLDMGIGTIWIFYLWFKKRIKF